jgi:hypothetical protein
MELNFNKMVAENSIIINATKEKATSLMSLSEKINRLQEQLESLQKLGFSTKDIQTALDGLKAQVKVVYTANEEIVVSYQTAKSSNEAVDLDSRAYHLVTEEKAKNLFVKFREKVSNSKDWVFDELPKNITSLNLSGVSLDVANSSTYRVKLKGDKIDKVVMITTLRDKVILTQYIPLVNMVYRYTYDYSSGKALSTQVMIVDKGTAKGQGYVCRAQDEKLNEEALNYENDIDAFLI